MTVRNIHIAPKMCLKQTLECSHKPWQLPTKKTLTKSSKRQQETEHLLNRSYQVSVFHFRTDTTDSESTCTSRLRIGNPLLPASARDSQKLWENETRAGPMKPRWMLRYIALYRNYQDKENVSHNYPRDEENIRQ